MAGTRRPTRDRRWVLLVGQWIREQREEVLGMRQGELAEFLDVTRSTVNKWENGKVSVPVSKAVAIHHLVKLARRGIRDRGRLRERLDQLTVID